MPLPKRRHSRTRSRKRRTNWVIAMPSLVECSHCGSKKKAHQICPQCGYYKGREVKEVETA